MTNVGFQIRSLRANSGTVKATERDAAAGASVSMIPPAYTHLDNFNRVEYPPAERLRRRAIELRLRCMGNVLS